MFNPLDRIVKFVIAPDITGHPVGICTTRKHKRRDISICDGRCRVSWHVAARLSHSKNIYTNIRSGTRKSVNHSFSSYLSSKKSATLLPFPLGKNAPWGERNERDNFQKYRILSTESPGRKDRTSNRRLTNESRCTINLLDDPWKTVQRPGNLWTENKGQTQKVSGRHGARCEHGAMGPMIVIRKMSTARLQGGRKRGS